MIDKIYEKGTIIKSIIPSAKRVGVHPHVVIGTIQDGENTNVIVYDTETFAGTSKWPDKIDQRAYFLVLPDEERNGLDTVTGFDLTSVEVLVASNLDKKIKVMGHLSEKDMERFDKAIDQFDQLSDNVKINDKTEVVVRETFESFNASQDRELMSYYGISQDELNTMKQDALNRKPKHAKPSSQRDADSTETQGR